MGKILMFGYSILDGIKQVGKKVIEFGHKLVIKYEAWLENQYDLRERWAKARPILDRAYDIVPIYKMKINRTKAVAQRWANENQAIRDASNEVLVQNQILSLVIGHVLEFESVSASAGTKFTNFYEIFAQLPDEIKRMILEQVNIDIESLSLGEKPPECFREYGKQQHCDKDILDESGLIIVPKCSFGRRCEMRKSSDEKLEKAKRGELEEPSLPIIVEVINPEVIPIATPIQDTDLIEKELELRKEMLF